MKLNEIVNDHFLVVKTTTKFGEILRFHPALFKAIQKFCLDEEIDGSDYNTMMNLDASDFLKNPVSQREAAQSVFSSNKPIALIPLQFRILTKDNKAAFKILKNERREDPIIIKFDKDVYAIRSFNISPNEEEFKRFYSFPLSEFNKFDFNDADLSRYRDEIIQGKIRIKKDTDGENWTSAVPFIKGWVSFS